MVIIKTKISTITAVIATIVMIAALGSIGGGMGLGQQQMALAQVLSPGDIGGDVGDIGDTVRNILEDELDRVGEIQNIPNCPLGDIIFRLPTGALVCVPLFPEEVPGP